jgi:type IV secretion system protein VirD4
MFFWLAGKLAQAYRLAPGADISAKVINIRTGFAYAFDSLAPSFYPQDMLFGIAVAVILWFVVWNKKRNAKKFRKDIEHGSARWGTPADIKPFMAKNPDDNIILTATEAVVCK